MNWLPQTPTENLYKFSAIWGLRLILGMLIFLAWLISIEIKIEKEENAAIDYYRSQTIIYDITPRIESIQKGDFDKNKLSWTPAHWSTEKEKEFLQRAVANHRLSMTKNKNVMSASTGSDLEILERLDVQVAGISYIASAVTLFLFGFGGWKRKIHEIENRMREADLITKELTNEKILMEIRLLRQSIHGHTPNIN